MEVSVILLTKNCQKIIKRSLKSIAWAKEIVIIDDFSEDETVKVARSVNLKGKLRVYRRHLKNDFASQRNFGLMKAKLKWVLFVDADEVVSLELKKEITNLEPKNSINGYLIPRRDFLWGKKLRYGETGKMKLLRLGKKGCGSWERGVHEYWNIKGNLGNLKSEIAHHPHENLSKFMEQINYYSSLHAKELQKEGKRGTIFNIIAQPIGKFIQNYFFKLGFLDGIYGLIMAIMMSIHSFLGWSKLWLNEKN